MLQSLTDNGLARLDPATGKIISFGPANGLSEIEFRTGSVMKDKYGRIYFGCSNGVIYFNPESVVENHFIPPVTITDFVTENVSVRMKDNQVKYLRFSNNDTIRLSYLQSSFSIMYSSMLFSFPG